MVKPSSPSSSAAAAASSCKYKGVRKRKWGKYVSEIRLPNSRERIWLGSYDTAEKAARAFDAALFCLRGRNARFNFPDHPPEIAGGRSMTPAEIQAAAARFARAAPGVGPRAAVENLDSGSDSMTSPERVESPCPSVSHVDCEMTEIPLDNVFLDQFLSMGTDNINVNNNNNHNNISDFGLFPGFDDLSGDFLVPNLTEHTYWPDNSEDFLFSEASLWSF